MQTRSPTFAQSVLAMFQVVDAGLVQEVLMMMDTDDDDDDDDDDVGGSWQLPPRPLY